MAWWRRSKTDTETRSATTTASTADFPLIRLQGITKIFKGDADEETRALSDVTVDIGRGEYVTVSGPSGCGKSTFLAILALLDSPTSGRYWLNGKATGSLSPSERARTRNVDVGLIFQSFNLIGDMSVYENVEYPLTVRGASASERRQRVAIRRHEPDGLAVHRIDEIDQHQILATGEDISERVRDDARPRAGADVRAHGQERVGGHARH